MVVFGGQRLTGSVAGKAPAGRRGDSGLTTLEWLLIVAAVAGLAALAVVLVTNVVSDTSEQISGSSARLTAVRLAADEITTKARAHGARLHPASNIPGDTEAKKKAYVLGVAREYKNDCESLRIIYSDIENLEVHWDIDISTTSGGNPAWATFKQNANKFAVLFGQYEVFTERSDDIGGFGFGSREKMGCIAGTS
ncbi:MAG: hypothetical protein OXC06_18140 [Acidimicrobiaceae bacterium]|nr:hypothetical protein [Acidimicrobiaceae bacterium]